MDNRLLTIIRLKKHGLQSELLDEERLEDFGYPGVSYKIPSVRVVARTTAKGVEFVDKPLLLNYGFVEIPLEYARDPVALGGIREISEVVLSFFYRKKEDIKLQVKMAKEEGLNIIPTLVETISYKELALLYDEAKKVRVKQTSEELEEGSYIVLKNYPFEGLGAKILKKKANGKVQIEILSSSLQVWVDNASLTYEDLSIYDPLNE